MPLGQNREGYWEFWHMATGDAPAANRTDPSAPGVADGIVMVLLPGGAFSMGAQSVDQARPNYDRDCESREGPVCVVTLDAFFLSKYEMTKAQWSRATGLDPIEGRAGKGTGLHPVEHVDWNACRAVLTRSGLELPTEAQWEYACRANGAGVVWTGDDPAAITRRENLLDRSFSDGYPRHARVGAFAANPFGLHDLQGNVTEWCRDGFTSYGDVAPRSADGLRRGVGEVTLRIGRGAAFDHGARAARSAARVLIDPKQVRGTLGVRPGCRVRR